MKVKLIGGAGYVGSKLARWLIHEDHHVIIDDLQESVVASNVGPPADANVFLAWPQMKEHEQDEYRAMKDVQTLRYKFCRACEDSEKNVFISSVQAVNPQNHYAECKAEMESFLFREFPDRVKILRISTVHGLSPNMRWDLVVHSMIRAGYTARYIEAQGPRIIRPHVHINRVCSAIQGALEDFGPGWNLAGEPLCDFCETIGDLASCIGRALRSRGERGESYQTDPPRVTRELIVKPNNFFNVDMGAAMRVLVDQAAPIFE
jgi:nucleoside-diphosphate-sugar epimerase